MAHNNADAMKFKQWVLSKPTGFDALQKSSVSVPLTLGDYDVLVKVMAVSLNYRDILIAKGKNPYPIKNNVIPGSDGAGIVVGIGVKVTEYLVGDRVATTFMRDHSTGHLTKAAILSSLGAAVDGTLTEFGIFPQHSLVPIKGSLSFVEASTLSCAGVTAWTSLYSGQVLRPGHVVLTQGTSGVSLFALQLAIATGATVIATTSSTAKGKFLKSIGATHIINYNKETEWGQKAKNLTPGGVGVDIIVEIGGPASLRQSLQAVKLGGTISLVGNVGSDIILEPPFHPVEILASQATIRSIGVGNRNDFLELLGAIDANGIKPIINEQVFKMHEVREAYRYMADRKHIGKVVIDLAE